MNQQEIEFLTYERQATFLAEAEQRRLANAVAPAQVHPALAWVGQQLIALGQQLRGITETPAAPIISPTVAR